MGTRDIVLLAMFVNIRTSTEILYYSGEEDGENRSAETNRQAYLRFSITKLHTSKFYLGFSI